MVAPQASNPADRHTPSPDASPDFRFPRRRRIRRRPEFQQVMDRGIRVGDPRMTLWALPNRLGYTRLGLAVGRKHGSAVRRNRIKRLLREAFRLTQHELPAGLDLVCVPRAGGDFQLEGCRESFITLTARLARRLARR
ncbi:MAG: ribonuclease P protein component [Phycisphaerae bacterium]|nr:ribonuclease P protein component [Phycisphaerae bacterium]